MRYLECQGYTVPKRTQTSVKLLRWLNSGFKDALPGDTAMPRLRTLYALP